MTMIGLHRILIIVACRIIAVTLAAKVYDQRQTGDVNVQIELKDLRVVALLSSELLDDYTEYDYFYDYADFTIKPSNKPTASSTTKTTTENNHIAETTEPLSPQNSTSLDNVNSTEQNATLPSDEGASNAGQSNGTTISMTNADDKSPQNQTGEEESGPETATVTSSITPHTVQASPILRSQRRCKSGYVPNGDGRCRRMGRPWLSLLP